MRTYKKALFGDFWHLRGQTKGAKGAGPEYLNASAPERTDNSHDKHKDNRRGANLVPPGYGAEEGGELPRL